MCITLPSSNKDGCAEREGRIIGPDQMWQRETHTDGPDFSMSRWTVRSPCPGVEVVINHI